MLSLAEGRLVASEAILAEFNFWCSGANFSYTAKPCVLVRSASWYEALAVGTVNTQVLGH